MYSLLVPTGEPHRLRNGHVLAHFLDGRRLLALGTAFRLWRAICSMAVSLWKYLQVAWSMARRFGRQQLRIDSVTYTTKEFQQGFSAMVRRKQ